MEIVKLNKAELQEKYSSCRDLKEIIQRFENDIESKGRVLCSIRVNGMTFDESDEARFAEAAQNDIQTIEFGTSDRATLIRESAAAIKSYIEQLKLACENSADLFRSNKPQEAWTYFVEVTKGHEYLMEALMALKPNLIREKGAHLTEAWDTAEIHMMHTIRELLNAYEARDFVLLSDILEYELYNALGKWEELLSH